MAKKKRSNSQGTLDRIRISPESLLQSIDSKCNLNHCCKTLIQSVICNLDSTISFELFVKISTLRFESLFRKTLILRKAVLQL